MKVSQAFPSNFLKADDLNGQSVTVTIASADLESIGQGRDAEDKLVLKFQGKQKGMICNKTNASTITKLYGDDTDAWIGQRITLVAREVEYGGEMVLGLRVSLNKPAPMNSAPRPAAAAAPAPQPAPAPEPQPSAPPANWEPSQPVDDSVPF